MFAENVKINASASLTETTVHIKSVIAFCGVRQGKGHIDEDG